MQDDLIKKLEKVSLPDLENSSHRKALGIALINGYFREKKNWEIFNIFRIITSLGMMVLITILIVNNFIYPAYSLAKAKEIALNNPQIKELVAKGAIIKDIKVVNGKAYVLVQPSKEVEKPEATLITGAQKTEEKFVGALAEVDFKEKKVSKIEELPPGIIPLTEAEREKAKEIAKNTSEIQKVVPQEAEVFKINIIPPPMQLIKKGKSVQVIQEPGTEKKVLIIYKLGKNQWEGKINLTGEKTEEVNFLGEIEE